MKQEMIDRIKQRILDDTAGTNLLKEEIYSVENIGKYVLEEVEKAIMKVCPGGNLDHKEGCDCIACKLTKELGIHKNAEEV